MHNQLVTLQRERQLNLKLYHMIICIYKSCTISPGTKKVNRVVFDFTLTSMMGVITAAQWLIFIASD